MEGEGKRFAGPMSNCFLRACSSPQLMSISVFLLFRFSVFHFLVVGSVR